MLRVQVIQQLPAEVRVPAALGATDLDRRRPPMINFASDVLTQQQRWEEAKRVQALYPEGAADPALVETLMNDIALAREQAG